jgi:hypothetical protein
MEFGYQEPGAACQQLATGGVGGGPFLVSRIPVCTSNGLPDAWGPTRPIADLCISRPIGATWHQFLCHSTVNYSTLGYGDMAMSVQNRLLGALEAVKGVIMFGLTTGLLFTVFNALLRRGWGSRMN